MPIQPKFSVTQTELDVTVRIVTPYVRTTGYECLVEGNVLHFYCKPYLLRLNFAGSLKEEEEHLHVTYDVELDHGTWFVRAEKCEAVNFPDLDLLHVLLATPSVDDIGAVTSKLETLSVSSTAKGGTLIEVVDSHDHGDVDSSETITKTAASVMRPVSYGFNRRFEPPFLSKLKGEVLLLDIPEPDSIRNELRPLFRCAMEDTDFEMERFLGDYAEGTEDPLYQEAVTYIPQWLHPTMEWSEDDNARMASFKCQEVIVDNELWSAKSERKGEDCQGPEHIQLLATLIPILCSWAYDVRLTAGEPTVESAWTICKLSPVLAWLDDTLAVPDAPDAVLPVTGLDDKLESTEVPHGVPTTLTAYLRLASIAWARRAITYPYLRRWDLVQLCLQDVVTMFARGKREVLRQLLMIRQIVNRSEQHYMLSTLYLNDYCSWISFLSDATFATVFAALQDSVSSITPADLRIAGWSVTELHDIVLETQQGAGEDSDVVEEHEV